MKKGLVLGVSDDQMKTLDVGSGSAPECKQKPSWGFCGCGAHSTDTRGEESSQDCFLLEPLTAVERDNGGEYALGIQQLIHALEQFVIAERYGMTCGCSLAIWALQSVFEEWGITDDGLECCDRAVSCGGGRE